MTRQYSHLPREEDTNMGNRAVITTPEKRIGLYLHWNGGRDSVEPFLAYCEMKGYRAPSSDCYGWARLAQVIGNFFGGTNSIGIDSYEHTDRDNWDNGVYIVEGWDIVGREFANGEQSGYDFEDFLKDIDESMPEEEQLLKTEGHDWWREQVAIQKAKRDYTKAA